MISIKFSTHINAIQKLYLTPLIFLWHHLILAGGEFWETGRTWVVIVNDGFCKGYFVYYSKGKKYGTIPLNGRAYIVKKDQICSEVKVQLNKVLQKIEIFLYDICLKTTFTTTRMLVSFSLSLTKAFHTKEAGIWMLVVVVFFLIL